MPHKLFCNIRKQLLHICSGGRALLISQAISSCLLDVLSYSATLAALLGDQNQLLQKEHDAEWLHAANISLSMNCDTIEHWL